MRSSNVIKGVVALLSLLLAAVAEQYAERLWVVTMPSGNREFYHSTVSHRSLVIVFFAVAIVEYKLGVRILIRRRTVRIIGKCVAATGPVSENGAYQACAI